MEDTLNKFADIFFICETKPIAKRKEEKLLMSKKMSVLVQDLKQVFPILDQWKFTGWKVKRNE